MHLKNESEAQFWIKSSSYGNKNCVYLTPIETKAKRIKMTGGIPFLWEYNGTEVIGPDLYDDDRIYRVIDVDYRHNDIWLEEVDN